MVDRSPPQIFNRRLTRLRRERAAKSRRGDLFLHRRAMEDIADRLASINREFRVAAFAGADDFTSLLTPDCTVGEIFNLDSALPRLPKEKGRKAVCDEEALPLAEESLDLVVSLLTLHAVNDLIGALAQIRRALKPDGLFIAAMFGEQTLRNLKRALYQAETETTGGVAPRISPFATVQDLGQALSRAGFALPVVDIDKVDVRYEDPLNLIRDLRAMGETSALHAGPSPLRRSAAARAFQLFSENGGEERFDIVYLTGWAPHESQQKPLAPGSGKRSLADAVKHRSIR